MDSQRTAPEKFRNPDGKKPFVDMRDPNYVFVGEKWEMQPNESPKAYAAFWTYVELGEYRSLSKLALALGNDNPNYRMVLGRWSGANRWVERVGAYETHLQKIKREAFEQQIRDRVARVFQDTETMLENQADVASKLFAIAKKKMLGDADIKPEVDFMDPGDVMKLLALSVKTEQEARERLLAHLLRQTTEGGSEKVVTIKFGNGGEDYEVGLSELTNILGATNPYRTETARDESGTVASGVPFDRDTDTLEEDLSTT